MAFLEEVIREGPGRPALAGTEVFQEVKDGTRGEARWGEGRQKVQPTGNHRSS